MANPGQGPGDALNARDAVGSFDEYCRLFEKSAGRKALGEASTDTLFHFERSIPSIQRYLGDPRIIIILRDPVKRAYSAYNHLVRDGREELPFKNALIAEEQRMRGGYVYMWQYQEGGLFAKQVRAFQKHFSRVQVLLYDDLKINAVELIRSVYTFLDVNPDLIPDMQLRHNVSGIPRWPILYKLLFKHTHLQKSARSIGKAILGEDRWVSLRELLSSANLQELPPIDHEIEQQLRLFYRADILKLQEYIGRDLSSWLD